MLTNYFDMLMNTVNHFRDNWNPKKIENPHLSTHYIFSFIQILLGDFFFKYCHFLKFIFRKCISLLIIRMRIYFYCFFLIVISILESYFLIYLFCKQVHYICKDCPPEHLSSNLNRTLLKHP